MSEAVDNEQRRAIAAECERVLADFAYARDFDHDALGALLTDDSVLEIPGKTFSGRAEITAFSLAMPAMQTMHHFGNIRIDVESGSAARSTAYVTVVIAVRDGEGRPVPQQIVHALYRDRFALKDGAWKLAERKVQPVIAIKPEAA